MRNELGNVCRLTGNGKKLPEAPMAGNIPGERSLMLAAVRLLWESPVTGRRR